MFAYGGDREKRVRPVILQVGHELALRIESQRERLLRYWRRQIAQRPRQHLAQEWVRPEPVHDAERGA